MRFVMRPESRTLFIPGGLEPPRRSYRRNPILRITKRIYDRLSGLPAALIFSARHNSLGRPRIAAPTPYDQGVR